MTKSNPLHNSILRKLSAISLFLIMAITLTFSQEIKKIDTGMNFENEWWIPILKKHNITPTAFNNFGKVFEMGTTNSIDGGIVTLENAVFVIRSDSDAYTIIKTPHAIHDLDKNIIRGDKEVTIDVYKYNLEDPRTLHAYSTGFTYHLKDGKNEGIFKKGQVKYEEEKHLSNEAIKN